MLDNTKQDADVLIVQTTVASAQTKILSWWVMTQISLFFGIMLTSMQTIFSCLLRIHRHLKLKRYGAYNSARLGMHLLLMHIHVIFGCETTSRLFGLGKGIAVKQVSDSYVYNCAQT